MCVLGRAVAHVHGDAEICADHRVAVLVLAVVNVFFLASQILCERNVAVENVSGTACLGLKCNTP